MKSMLSVLGAAALLVLGGTAATASTYVLNFAGNICAPDPACVNGSFISQSYGDVAGEVDVDFEGDTGFDSGDEDMRLAIGAFGGLVDQAAIGFNKTEYAISLIAAPGKEIVLNSFDIVPFREEEPKNFIFVYERLDGPDVELYDSGEITFEKNKIRTFSTPGGWTGKNLFLWVYLDNDDLGMTNINFTVQDESISLTPIPLPAALPMAAAALAALGLVGRRRRG